MGFEQAIKVVVCVALFGADKRTMVPLKLTCSPSSTLGIEGRPRLGTVTLRACFRINRQRHGCENDGARYAQRHIVGYAAGSAPNQLASCKIKKQQSFMMFGTSENTSSSVHQLASEHASSQSSAQKTPTRACYRNSTSTSGSSPNRGDLAASSPCSVSRGRRRLLSAKGVAMRL